VGVGAGAVGSFFLVRAMKFVQASTHHQAANSFLSSPQFSSRRVDLFRSVAMAEGLGEDGGDEDHFLTNYHLSSQYKREKFSQKLNGIILSTRSCSPSVVTHAFYIYVSAQEILSGGKVIAVNDYFFLKNIGHGSFGDVKLATKDLVEDDLLEDHQRYELVSFPEFS
jgi:hypothetical protein